MKSQWFFCLSSVLCMQSTFSGLQDADATSSDWPQQKSHFKGQSFSKLVLSNKNLNGIDLTGCKFKNVKFCGTNLQNSILQNVSFKGCDMTGVDLTNSNLTGSKFDSDVVLSNAILVGVKLTNVDLSKIPRKNLANIKIGVDNNSKDVLIDFSTKTDLQLIYDYSYLITENVSNTVTNTLSSMLGGLKLQLVSQDLHNQSLNGINLSGANLNGCDLSGANLSGANLSGAASLNGCDLSGANLTGAILKRDNLVNIILGDSFWIDFTVKSNQNILDYYNMLVRNGSNTGASTLKAIMICLNIPIPS